MPAAKKAAKKSAAKKTAVKTAVKSSAKQLRSPERVAEILRRLRAAYPNVVCALNHRNAWELVAATILSAQCTDVRVNIVTPELFRIFPTPRAMAEAPIPAIEEIIRTTGFYRNKAKSLKGAAQVLLKEFNGKVPETMDELLKLPGVARKTANVVLGSWYGIGVGVVVDTHVFRISHRLDLAHGNTPQKVEQELMEVLPQERWIQFSHEIIHHGRAICIARKPRCAACTLEDICYAPDKTV